MPFPDPDEARPLELADLIPDVDDGIPVDDLAEPDDAGLGEHDELVQR